MQRFSLARRLGATSALLATGLCGPVLAQQYLFVADSTDDKIWRLEDLNTDGDFNDAGEVVNFYDDATGPFMLTNNVGITVGSDGTAYVSDNSEDIVFAFGDSNADGDALDAGEARIYFDGRVGGNADGLLMNSASSLWFDATDGSIWVASATTGVAGSVDEVFRIRDVNSDGDCNDLGETLRYWTAPTAPGGDYLPVAVIRDPATGLVLYVDNRSSPTGVVQGVFALTDLNSDGDAQDAGERTEYFIPPVTSAQVWSIDRDAAGWYYMNDQTQDVIWRFKDLNADGDAQDVGEFSIWWAVGAASIQWDVAIRGDGTVFSCEQTAPKRVYALNDANADGVIGAGEQTTPYDANVSATPIGNLRGIALGGPSFVGTAYCFGDGAGTACPCGNNSAAAAQVGCLNSLGLAGKLRAIGRAQVGSDTLSLQGSGLPNGPGLYFQGTTQLNGGNGIVFGDGLRCAGGLIVRLGIVTASGNASAYPRVGIDAPVSVQGLCLPGDVRHYQLWYRDSDPVFCTAAVFDLTNALTITWQ